MPLSPHMKFSAIALIKSVITHYDISGLSTFNPIELTDLSFFIVATGSSFMLKATINLFIHFFLI